LISSPAFDVASWVYKITEYGVKFKVLQVVERMERETGIEPATNSLEG
jgi:hypothetical protein